MPKQAKRPKPCQKTTKGCQVVPRIAGIIQRWAEIAPNHASENHRQPHASRATAKRQLRDSQGNSQGTAKGQPRGSQGAAQGAKGQPKDAKGTAQTQPKDSQMKSDPSRAEPADGNILFSQSRKTLLSANDARFAIARFRYTKRCLGYTTRIV